MTHILYGPYRQLSSLWLFLPYDMNHMICIIWYGPYPTIYNLEKAIGFRVSQMITGVTNIMQSCLDGGKDDGMMELLTDQIMQTINEKQLVASENVQDRIDPFTVMVVARRNLAKKWKSMHFVDWMHQISWKTTQIASWPQQPRPRQLPRQQQLQPLQRPQIHQIYVHPMLIQTFNVHKGIFAIIFLAKTKKEPIPRHLQLEFARLALLILPNIAKITIFLGGFPKIPKIFYIWYDSYRTSCLLMKQVSLGKRLFVSTISILKTRNPVFTIILIVKSNAMVWPIQAFI